MIYAIDFDGTIVENAFPDIGQPKHETLRFIWKLQEYQHQWILWTLRHDKELDEAVEWCSQHGLHPDAVNDNLPCVKAAWNDTNPRKIHADVYIDDRNAGGLYLPSLDGFVDFSTAMRFFEKRM